MSVINNLSGIPFYKSRNEQDYRLWYAYGETSPLCVPSDTLLPFSFCDTFTGEEVLSVTLYDACSDSPVVFQALSFLNNIHIDTIGDYKRITFAALPGTSYDITPGAYYFSLSVGSFANPTIYFSEVFRVMSREDITRLTCIKWRNEEAIEYEGGSIPPRPYWSTLYLDTTIGMPEYNFTEEGEERNGHFFPIKQISEKTYKFNLLAPEYLCDIMRTIRMADEVHITDTLGREFQVEHFELEVNWAEQGHYAIVDCSFQTDTIVKKIGKAYNI